MKLPFRQNYTGYTTNQSTTHIILKVQPVASRIIQTGLVEGTLINSERDFGERHFNGVH